MSDSTAIAAFHAADAGRRAAWRSYYELGEAIAEIAAAADFDIPGLVHELARRLPAGVVAQRAADRSDDRVETHCGPPPDLFDFTFAFPREPRSRPVLGPAGEAARAEVRALLRAPANALAQGAGE